MEDLTKQLADLEAQIDGISKKFEVAATADEVKAVKKEFTVEVQVFIPAGTLAARRRTRISMRLM